MIDDGYFDSREGGIGHGEASDRRGGRNSLVAAAVVIWWQRLGADVPHAAAQAPAPGIPVTAGTVAAQDVPVFLHGIGTVQAYNSVAIKSRVDGQIVNVVFKEGQDVKEGDPLFQIDPRAVSGCAASRRRRRNKRTRRNWPAPKPISNATKNFGLRGGRRGRATTSKRPRSPSCRRRSRATRRRSILPSSTSATHDIRSPIDGRLGARLVDKGNLVHANDNTALVTITELKPIFVSFTLPQETLDDIREQNKQAPLAVRAYSGDGKKQLADGKLTLIDNMIDQSTGTIRLKARFDNEDERLWPGEFVSVRVILSVRKGSPRYPSQTVQQGPSGHYAYVIKPDNTVERRVVEVASIQDGIAVITKGLAAGERVVVDGQYRLTNGARVKLLRRRPPGRAG